MFLLFFFFFFQAEDGIRDLIVTGVQTCALPISSSRWPGSARPRRCRTSWTSATCQPCSGITPPRSCRTWSAGMTSSPGSTTSAPDTGSQTDRDSTRAAQKKQRRLWTCSPGKRRTPSSPPRPPWPARATWPSRWTSSPRACSGIPAAAAILVACRVAASWTAFALAGTAKPDAAGGWEIPALYSAASDQPVPVTQDCTSSSGFQVCVHPAFSFYLDDLAAAFDPVAAEIAGLPGAPVGAKEVASMSGGQDVQSG